MKSRLMAALPVATMAVNSFAFDANNPPPPIPNGWSFVERVGNPYSNVRIYQKGSEQTYVQVADMTMGAHVKLMQYRDTSKSGPINYWWINDIEYWWNQMGSDATGRVSVFNGQFFDNSGVFSQKNPTTLSYGVKADWSIADQGSDVNANGGYQLKQMNFGARYPWVSNWAPGSLETSTAKDAIVGLDRRANKRSAEAIGRTYLCAKPYASNWLQQSVWLLVIYTSTSKTQATANSELDTWGCSLANTVMMDGSGSSKLRTKGGLAFTPNDSRRIPQAIGLYN